MRSLAVLFWALSAGLLGEYRWLTQPAAQGSVLDVCLLFEKQKSQISIIKTNINFVYILYIMDLEYDWDSTVSAVPEKFGWMNWLELSKSCWVPDTRSGRWQSPLHETLSVMLSL